MLTLRPIASKRGSFWRPGTAYAIRHDDTQIRQIDISGVPDQDAHISLREQFYTGRISITGKKRWTHVPSRWVMSSGDAALHSAICESNSSFVTEDEPGQEPIRLRRHGISGSCIIERVSDQQPLGEISYLRPRLLPKAEPQRFACDMNADLSETVVVLLLWICVHDLYKNEG